MIILDTSRNMLRHTPTNIGIAISIGVAQHWNLIRSMHMPRIPI